MNDIATIAKTVVEGYIKSGTTANPNKFELGKAYRSVSVFAHNNDDDICNAVASYIREHDEELSNISGLHPERICTLATRIEECVRTRS